MKRGSDFKKQAKKYDKDQWLIHKCLICGYSYGFIFLGGKVYFDNSCHCAGYNNFRLCVWDDDVVNHYNL